MSLRTLMLAIMFCGLTAANTGVNVDMILAQYKQALQTLWNMRNDRLVYANQNDDACFDWYFKAIDDNMNAYWNNTAICENQADDEIKSLNAQGAATRSDLVDRKRSICGNFDFCEEKSDLLQFYDCYGYVSSNNTPTIYEMSADSNAEYKILLVKYNNVEAGKIECDDTYRDQYIQSSEWTDKQFLSCRGGGGVPKKSAGW